LQRFNNNQRENKTIENIEKVRWLKEKVKNFMELLENWGKGK